MYITLVSLILYVSQCMALDDDLWENLNITLRSQLKVAFNRGPLRNLLGHSGRLAFHDCGGPDSRNSSKKSICDGCFDFDNADHAGLEFFAASKLEEIYQTNWTHLSRADFWMIAANMAMQYGQSFDTVNGAHPAITNLPFYIGRKDCIADRESKGGDVSASQKANQKRFPQATGTFKKEGQQWFQHNFGFTLRETIALLGVHTLGQMHMAASGFGTNFWVFSWGTLNNDFYTVLLNNNFEQIENEKGLFQWHSGSQVYLNTDMGMKIDIEDNCDSYTAMSPTGECNCTQSEDCATNDEALDIVKEFAANNTVWLNEFVPIWIKMTTMGYNLDELERVDPIRTTEFFETTNIAEECQDDDPCKGQMKHLSQFIVLVVLFVSFYVS